MFARFFSLWILSGFLVGCSCNGGDNGALRIGIDSDWYPIDFGAQEPYVNGFTQELLLEIAQYSGLTFEKVPANWDTLLEGMKREKYDVVLTSLPPYNFNEAKYDFSQNFLDLGPVLVVQEGSSLTKLSQIKEEMVGVVTGNPAVLLLQKCPEIIVRNFASVPELFDALAFGEIEAALHDRLPTLNYIRDLYRGRLKIASKPLNETGLHLVAPKGKYNRAIKAFDSALKQLKKKKKLQALAEKWEVGE